MKISGKIKKVNIFFFLFFNINLFNWTLLFLNIFYLTPSNKLFFYIHIYKYAHTHTHTYIDICIYIIHTHTHTHTTFLVAQTVKCLPAIQVTQVRTLGREDPLEKEMQTNSSTPACKILWTEEPG